MPNNDEVAFGVLEWDVQPCSTCLNSNSDSYPLLKQKKTHRK